MRRLLSACALMSILPACHRGAPASPDAQAAPTSAAEGAQPTSMPQSQPAAVRRHADPGHRAMVAELARIRPVDLPYLGFGEVQRRRTAYAGLPPDAPPPQRFDAQCTLAYAELLVGNNERALALLAEAAALIAAAPAPARPRLQERHLYLSGLAHLRLAEARNCRADHAPEACIAPLQGRGIHQDKAAARAAKAEFEALLRLTTPGSWGHALGLWLLNISAMAVGEWPEGLPPTARIPWPKGAPFPRFENIAGRLGVASYDHCGGALADDFDGDGLLDLVSSSYHPRGQLKLWIADGAGGYTDRTAAAGLEGLFGGQQLSKADFDNDGDLDILVLRGAWSGDKGRHPNSLLRNDGGTFTDVTVAVGLGDRFPTQTAAWADYDNDGDLDLYVGAEDEPGLAFGSRLYRNDKGRFVDVTQAAGVANDSYAKGVAWGDYDGDRRPDLYVSNQHGLNRLYHNRGDGTFEDVATRIGVAAPMDSFAVWFWDYDQDGHLDLMVQGYITPEHAPHAWYVAASWLGRRTDNALPRLYRGDGRGRFEEVTERVGLSEPTLPMGADFGDLDQDGWLDVYLGTGYPGLEGLIPNRMYRNAGGVRFEDVTRAGGFGHLQKGHGVAFADLDNDGDQDIWHQVGGFYEADAFSNALFHNPGFGRHWINVELRGVKSNRFGVGARIEVELRGRTLYRHVGYGSSYGGSPIRQYVGLGDAKAIERLVVYWPTSDTRQVIERPPLDRFLRVTEGEPGVEVLERKPVRLR